MKVVGWIMAALGLVYIIIAFNMDVSVSAPTIYSPYGSIGGGEVANLDLMARRQNHLIFASLITLVGVLIGLFAPSGVPGEAVAATSAPAPRPVDFDGERDLKSDPYRLWLADTYGIARNDVFDRFVMGDATFASLDEALAKADEAERLKLAEKEEAERQRQEAAEQARLEAIAYHEAEEARMKRLTPWLIGAISLVTAAVVAAIYFTAETPEERAAREAAELAIHDARVKTLSEKWGIELPREVIHNAYDAREGQDFLCNDRAGGEMFELKPDTQMATIHDAISKTLGEKRTFYETDDGSSWNWEKNGVRADLHLIGAAIDLCLQKTD